MLSYAIKRIGLAVLIIFVVMLAMYAMVFLVPGDPASLALGPRATPELKRALMERMGLDQPIYVQVWNFFRNALTGDLGYDVWSKRPVSEMIAEVFPNTLFLGAVAIGSFSVHYMLVTNTTWVKKFLDGKGATTAMVTTPAATAAASPPTAKQ